MGVTPNSYIPPSAVYPSTILHPNSVRLEPATVEQHSRVRKIRSEGGMPLPQTHVASPAAARVAVGTDSSPHSSAKKESSTTRKGSRRHPGQHSEEGDGTGWARTVSSTPARGQVWHTPDATLTADVDCGAAVMAMRRSHRVQRPAMLPSVFPSPLQEPSLLFRGFHPLRITPHCIALCRRIARAPKDPKPLSWERRKRKEQEEQDAQDTKALPGISTRTSSPPLCAPVPMEKDKPYDTMVEKELADRNREHQFWKLQLALQLIKRTNLYKLFVRSCDYRTRIHLLLQQADFVVKSLENDVGNLQQPPLVLGYHPLVWMLSIPNANFTCKDLLTHFTDLGGARNSTSMHRHSSVGAISPSPMDTPGRRSVALPRGEVLVTPRHTASPPPLLPPSSYGPNPGLGDRKHDTFSTPQTSPRSSILHYLRTDEDRAIFQLLSQTGLSHVPHSAGGGGAPHARVEQKSGVAVLLDTLLTALTKPPMKPLYLEEFHRVLNDVSEVLRKEMRLMQVVLNRLQERIAKRKNTLTKDVLRACSQYSQPHVQPDAVLESVVYHVPTELELLLLEYPDLQPESEAAGGEEGTKPGAHSTANVGKFGMKCGSMLPSSALPVTTMTVKERSPVGIHTERTLEEVELWFRFVRNFHVTGVSTLKVEHVLESVAVIMADVCAPLLLPECAHQLFGYNGVYAKEIAAAGVAMTACPSLKATRLPEDPIPEEEREEEGKAQNDRGAYPSHSWSKRECSATSSKGRGLEGSAGSLRKRICSLVSRGTVWSTSGEFTVSNASTTIARQSAKSREGKMGARKPASAPSHPTFQYSSIDLSCGLFALDVLGHDPLHVHHDLEFALEEIAQLLEYARTLCIERRVETQLYREATCVHDQGKRHELNALHMLWTKETDELLHFMWKGELRVGNVHFIHSLLREYAPNMYKAFQEEHRIYLSGYLPSVSGELFSSLVARYNPFRQRTASKYVQSEVQKNYPTNFLIMAVCHESLAQLKECENIVFWVMLKYYKAAMKAYREKMKRLEGPQEQPIPPKGPLLFDPERIEAVTIPGYHLNEKANPLLLPHCSKAIQILSWLEKLVGYPVRRFTTSGATSTVPEWIKKRHGDAEGQQSAGRPEGGLGRLSLTSHTRASSISSSLQQGISEDLRREGEDGQADSTKSIMLRTLKGAGALEGKPEKNITQYGVMDCFIVTDYKRQLYEAPESQNN